MFALTHLGYPALFLVLALESLGIPMPSELSLMAAGYLAWRGDLSLPLIVLIGAAGSTTGAFVAYQIAIRGGRRLVVRYGTRVGITHKRLDAAEAFFTRYGTFAVVIGRVVSGVRALISYPAGLFEMPLVPFLLATAVGAVLWPVIAAGAGYLLGPSWRRVLNLSTSVLTWALPIAAMLVALYLVWRWRRMRHAQESASEDARAGTGQDGRGDGVL